MFKRGSSQLKIRNDNQYKAVFINIYKKVEEFMWNTHRKLTRNWKQIEEPR
jgi:hypothetical protein